MLTSYLAQQVLVLRLIVSVVDRPLHLSACSVTVMVGCCGSCTIVVVVFSSLFCRCFGLGCNCFACVHLCSTYHVVLPQKERHASNALFDLLAAVFVNDVVVCVSFSLVVLIVAGTWWLTQDSCSQLPLSTSSRDLVHRFLASRQIGERLRLLMGTSP